uniref:Uncharacterized protein n=1 Tax=Anopheles atroparvus TaxID=41427 RepID=A0A182ILU0_ANOAO
MATNPFKHPPPTPSTSENCSTYDDYDEPAPLQLSSAPATPSSGSGGVSSTAPDSSSSSSILKQRATCACSNISIMQLFHEMKQRYPTVPDTVVSELVTQNCHDRPACVSKLEEAVLGTPGQTTYPAQSIHSGSLKRRGAEHRSRLAAGSRQDGNGLSNSSGSNSSTSSRESSVDSSRLRVAGSDVGGSGLHERLSGDGRVPTLATHRPTTLAFGSASSAMGYGGGHGCGVPPPPPMRPNRTAPSCPPSAPLATSTITTTTTASGNADLGETVNLQVNVTVSPKAGGPLHVGQRHTSTISLQPEPPYSRELAQVSSTFNSGVPAPGGGACLAGGPTRGNPAGGVSGGAGNGTTTAGGSGGGRSSTSVNLTLRQPTDGRPHSPIHIHASPLKYTSKNFNAQAGIQSKLEVTFRDGFGSFSAMRAQVPRYEAYQGTQHQQHRPLDTQTSPNTLQYQQQEPMDGYRFQPPGTSTPSRFLAPLSSSSPLPSVVHRLQASRGLTAGALRGGSMFTAGGGQLENDGLTKEMRYQNFVVAEMAVSQQLEQKQRLGREVERKQIQFESICREIFVLQQPLRYIDAELLDREVLLLAAEVEQLQKEVDSCDDEEARAVAAATAAAAAAAGSSITDGLSALSVEGGSPMLPSGAGSAAVVNRPPRPPRPPPPRATAQSPSRASSGSITPGTPLLPGAPFGGGTPGAPTSSASSSPCSTSSSFASNYGGGACDAPSSRVLPPTTGGVDDQATSAGSNQPWTCTLCTFQNHELMTSCELCTLPKASGSRTSLPENAHRSGLAMATTLNAALGTDVCDGGGGVGTVGATSQSAQLQPAQQQPQGQQQPSQQQPQQPQQPPPLQNAQYQKSSIEC